MGISKIPLSVESGIPSERQEYTQPHNSGTEQGETTGQQTTPPLSVDSRTLDMPGKTENTHRLDSAGTSPTASGGTGWPQRNVRKPVSVDIYRDDAPIAEGGSATKSSRPASAHQAQPIPSSQTVGDSQTVSHKDTRDTRIQRNVEGIATNTANSSHPAAGTSSPVPQAAYKNSLYEQLESLALQEANQIVDDLSAGYDDVVSTDLGGISRNWQVHWLIARIYPNVTPEKVMRQLGHVIRAVDDGRHYLCPGCELDSLRIAAVDVMLRLCGGSLPIFDMARLPSALVFF